MLRALNRGGGRFPRISPPHDMDLKTRSSFLSLREMQNTSDGRTGVARKSIPDAKKIGVAAFAIFVLA